MVSHLFRAYVSIVLHKRLQPKLEKSYESWKRFLNHKPFLRKFLTFLKNYPPKCEILGSVKRKGREKLPCINGFNQIFFQRVMALRKVNIQLFLYVLM